MSGGLSQNFSILKRVLPPQVWRPIRAVGTGVLTPFIFSSKTGHWKSSLAEMAKSPNGSPLPWYTYPAINFLSPRTFAGKTILEFGGGQSTLWWAKRAESVLTIEANAPWAEKLSGQIGPNVSLHHISLERFAEIEPLVCAHPKFDVIVIDGHMREELIPIGLSRLASGGALIFDNSDLYHFYELTADCGYSRIDFFGFSPGNSKQHCTSILFSEECFLFDSKIPIPNGKLD